ncbi:hypothetical protein [Phyllobacterium sp. UNC302MFCol5.2]|uniref:hypothetical protein n=1 Tax=Phyllobacterium sp. UNC302MFCol5.2 TaxID=1449065 RepID=UPI0012DEA6BF|nr:hypothetical protein [Phyllobacterium sp. UNC302MFCol5.2]
MDSAMGKASIFDGATIYAAASVVLVAFGYFTGFCYLWAYYGLFSVSLAELDLSLQYVLVHAFPAIWTMTKENWMIIVASIFFGWLAWYMTTIRQSISFISKKPVLLWFLLALAIPTSLYYTATASGSFNARRDISALKVVQIKLKSGSDYRVTDLSLAQTYYLASTERNTFVVVKAKRGPIWTLRLANDEIASIAVYSN